MSVDQNSPPEYFPIVYPNTKDISGTSAIFHFVQKGGWLTFFSCFTRRKIGPLMSIVAKQRVVSLPPSELDPFPGINGVKAPFLVTHTELNLNCKTRRI